MSQPHEAPSMDYEHHDKTYALFTGLIKWGAVFSLGLTLFFGAATGTVPWLLFLIATGGLIVLARKFL